MIFILFSFETCCCLLSFFKEVEVKSSMCWMCRDDRGMMEVEDEVEPPEGLDGMVATDEAATAEVDEATPELLLLLLVRPPAAVRLLFALLLLVLLPCVDWVLLLLFLSVSVSSFLL